MNKLLTRWALSLGLMLGLAAAASASELTLYEHANYGGARIVLRTSTPNFSTVGFNDRTSSLVVSAGRWELCTDADFKGQCVTVGPGDYPRMDARLNDRISSARDLDAPMLVAQPRPMRARGVIELYERTRFRGRVLTLDRDEPNLAASSFDDATSSVVVREGSWQLCADAAYGGFCQVLTPGRYTDLDRNLMQEISSVRLVSGGERGEHGEHGGRGEPGRPAPVVPGAVAQRSGIELFRGTELSGGSVVFTQDIGNLSDTGWNDRSNSLVVYSGRWEVCTDAWFGGQCAVFGVGSYPRLGNLGNQISSMRQVR